MTATRMLFRVFKGKDGGDVIAFILGYPCNPGRVMSYQHIGQHGEASFDCYRMATRPATRKERASLVRELQHIYGPIRILHRLPYHAVREGWQ